MVEFPKVFNKQSTSAPIEDSDELTVDIYEINDKPLFSDFEKSSSVTIPRNSKLLWIRAIRNTSVKLDSLFSPSIHTCIAQHWEKCRYFFAL